MLGFWFIKESGTGFICPDFLEDTLTRDTFYQVFKQLLAFFNPVLELKLAF